MKQTIKKIAFCLSSFCISLTFACQSNQDYPRLENIYLSNAEHTRSLQLLADQLRKGHPPDDRTPILLHGSSGTGKTTALNALINESNCSFLIVHSSIFFQEDRTSLSDSINKVFLNIYKKSKITEGVVLCIDDLDILFNKKVVSQLERENVLTELAIQLERFSQLPEYDHIRIIATANEQLPYPIRKLFKCIKFDHPDSQTMKKIIQDKAQHLELDVDIALSYHDKIKKWDLKRVTNFLIETKQLIQIDEESPKKAFYIAYSRDYCRNFLTNSIKGINLASVAFFYGSACYFSYKLYRRLFHINYIAPSIPRDFVLSRYFSAPIRR